MVRLALIGKWDDAHRCAQTAARLRGGEVTVIMSDDKAIAEHTAKELHAEVWASESSSGIAEHSQRFDAAIIHNPAEVSAGLCRQLTAAGKHVLLDSLLSMTSEAARNLIAACKSASAMVMVGHRLRFLPSLVTIKKCLDDGRLGEPGLVRIHDWRPSVTHDSLDGIESGLPMQLLDAIDVACWFFADTPNHLYACGRQPSSTVPSEWNYRQLHLGFGRGGMALIDQTGKLPPGSSYFSLSLIGSTGAAYVDDQRNLQLLFGAGQPTTWTTSDRDSALLGQWQEFVSSLNENRPPQITTSDALRNIELTEQLAESIATGRPLRRLNG